MTAGAAKRLRVLMSVDAVGGVWRYAMDLASGLKCQGVDVVFAGFGPAPSGEQTLEAERLGTIVWLRAPLDWLVEREEELADVPDMLSELARQQEVDLIHLNLPSQAAGLDVAVPVLAVSHSCVVTWFATVRGERVPAGWRWQERLNCAGLQRADLVVAPSHSHAAALKQSYPGLTAVEVVHNGCGAVASEARKEEIAFAAGRWWDDGKNAAILDAAAAMVTWPVVVAGPTAGPNGQHVTLKNVVERGALPHREIMEIMRRAAVVVSPSLYEPFGLAPLEAARTGAALVLADIPTYRELWQDAALLAAPGDPAAFADCVNRLAAEPTLRKELAQKAATRSKRFTVDAQANAMNRLYRSLAARTRTLSAA